MNQERSLKNWWSRFTQWSEIATDPAEHAATTAVRETIEEPGLKDMAQTLVDGMLQAGYGPNEVATAIARGAFVTIGEIVRDLGP